MQINTEEIKWNFLNKFLFRFFFVYTLLFMGSFSFPHPWFPDPGNYLSPFFEIIVRWSAKTIFGLGTNYTSELISDSTGMYIHAFNLFFISLIICSAWSLADKKRNHYLKLQYWFFVILRYYLALQLFTYGFNKVFKWQFYLPEPNTLFTTLGNTYSDLLYWSSMGVSRPYSMFTGALEVLCACALLFRRTTLIGALLTFGVMINVVMINFSYDISVKLYSLFLTLLTLIILAPYRKKLFQFFFKDKFSDFIFWCPDFFSGRKRIFYFSAKTFLISWILFSTLFDYVRSGNFNDDTAGRPLFFGAYTVEIFARNGDTLSPSLMESKRWKRFFVNSRGYFIVQGMKDEMDDFEMKYDIPLRALKIFNYTDSIETRLNYSRPNDSTFILHGNWFGDTLYIQSKKINLEKLPLLKKEFNWTIDGVE